MTRSWKFVYALLAGAALVGASASTASAATAVTWTAIVNAAASRSKLPKTAGCRTRLDRGGVSQQQLTTGSVSFSVPTGQRLVAGLNHAGSTGTSSSVDYSFQFWGTSSWEVREAGVYRTEGTQAAGDLYSITVDSSGVKYYRNGTLVYTSKIAPSSALVLDASLETIGSAVQNAQIGGTVSTAPAPAPAPAPSPTPSPTTTGTLRVLQWNT